MNIQQALLQASEQLSSSSPSASLDAQVLLTFVLQCNSAHLMAWPEKQLEDELTSRYFELIKKRKLGHPVAHLTGTREFWSLDFSVDDSTLIPRPETETLIEFILETFSDKKHIKLLDLGTGTGAIAIAIAKEKPNWKITACDISEQALELANRNKIEHQADNTTFILSDWFNQISDHDFDIIVSNPPYITDDDPHLLEGDVRFEPKSALTSGTTGLDDIKHLCSHAKEYLAENGWLIVEHGYNQQQLVSDCFAEFGYNDIVQKQDLSNHTRMTAGKRQL